MSLLWPHGANHNNMLLFVTDAGSYKVKAAKHLKMQFPTMIHITYTAHERSIKYINFYQYPVISTRIPVVIA